MKTVDKLNVYYHEYLVGTLFTTKKGLSVFQYDREWIGSGFSISPLALPLVEKPFIPKFDPFDGIAGVFADSLPDGWGRLLVDRYMRKKGFSPQKFGNLDRLAIVGASGMGALSYKPALSLESEELSLTYDEFAKECMKVLNEEDSTDLDLLFLKGGSSGGTRPKILTKIEDEDWIIKFPSANDRNNIGEEEYRYALCAKKCGIDMAPVKLFPSQCCSGYFGTKRFDRRGKNDTDRVHMVSVAALLETTHRLPNLDYDLLMRLTLQLTGSMAECMKLFRLMCFNVYAHNRDDHSKNFSFLFLENEKRWTLSPAYDLTYSESTRGEHATTVHGNGVNPCLDDILAVAAGIGIGATKARETALTIEAIVKNDLTDFL